MHDQRTRERLLDAATQLLATEGVTALTVRRLAGEIGESNRAIYSLFDGMPGLLAALYRRGFQTLVQLHEQVPRRADAATEIAPLAAAYRRAALEHRDLYGLMFERLVPSFCPSETDLAFALRGQHRVRDAVERALRQRGLRGDPDHITRQLWAIAHGLASLELRGMLGPEPECDRLWRDSIRVAVHGLLPGKPRATTDAPAARRRQTSSRRHHPE